MECLKNCIQAGRLLKQLKQLEQMKRGERRIVRHEVASDSDPSKCHDNVDRWCQNHPGDKPVRGWIVTGEYMFSKHSVVDQGAQNPLLDITLPDGAYSNFLIHGGIQEEFDKLLNVVTAIDV